VQPHAAALARELSHRILRSRSATAALLAWCEEHQLASGPVTVVRRLHGSAGAADSRILSKLNPEPGEPISYREVSLIRDRVVLAEAQNWFRPQRLKPSMLEALESTDLPFGTVIAPLRPRRQTFFVAYYDASTCGQRPKESSSHLDPIGDDPAILFEHRAVVSDEEHNRPLAVVRELYRAELIENARALPA
jgi:chorismate-pyruvate lyase